LWPEGNANSPERYDKENEDPMGRIAAGNNAASVGLKAKTTGVKTQCTRQSSEAAVPKAIPIGASKNIRR
jgi:hypothetical protein